MKTTDLTAITSAQALAEATLMLSNDETLYSGPEARRIVAGLIAGINRSPCFAKSMSTGCECFVLLETDPAAPATIDSWCYHAKGVHEDAKLADATVIARRWRERLAVKAK